MNLLPGLVSGILVILLVLPAPVPAAAPAGDGIFLAGTPSAASIITIAPQPPARNVSVVVRTTAVPAGNGSLALVSVPAGAAVSVDGNLRGITPLNIRSIGAGVHTVSYSMDGYADYQTKVTVTAGSVTRSSAVLVPVTPPPVTTTIPPNPAPFVVTVTAITTETPVQQTSPTVPLTTTTGVQRTEPTTTTPCIRQYLASARLDVTAALNCTTLITADGLTATLTIPEGARLTSPSGGGGMEVRIERADPTGLSPPPGTNWTSHAYRFLPDRASFDPAGMVSFRLSPEEWAQADLANLSIQATDGKSWERLPVSLNPHDMEISAPARHFSIIGLFSPAPEMAPAPVISPLPAGRSLPLSFLIPDRYAPLAAVVSGLVLTLFAASAAVSRAAGRLAALVEKFLGSEASGLLNVTEIERRGIGPSEVQRAIFLGLSLHELLVIGISAAGFAAAFLLQDRPVLTLMTIAVFLCAGGVATILHDLAHKFRARRCGCVAEYQLWSLGAILMLLTAWLFGNAFAKPSRTLIRSDRPLTPAEAASIRLAGPLVSTALAAISLFLIPAGGLIAVAASAGFTMNLLNSLFSLVPIPPNDGVEVFAWSRLAWAAVFIPLIALYLSIYLIG